VPELRQLRAFLAVAEELNFTRAGERLHVGQQAVSKSVRQLESELGVALLERTTREVRLTPAGRALLESGRQALDAADAAFDAARRIGHGRFGTVRIGVTPAIGPGTLEEVAAVLRDQAPDTSVAFQEVRPKAIPQLLRDRTVELVLCRTVTPSPGIESASLRPSPVELIVPAGHRLAGASSARLADLDGERLLTASPPGTAYTDLLLGWLRSAGAEVEAVEMRSTGGSEPPHLTEAGAVALLPEGWPPGKQNVRVPVADDVALPLRVLWPAGLPTPAVNRLRAAMGVNR
jgi:DNA-binding transcriptional LysR family regulator